MSAVGAVQAAATQDRSGRLGPEWVGVLATVPLFAGLSKRHLRRVAKLAQEVRIPPLTTIVSPSRTADSFFVILDGEAEVIPASGEGVALGAGDFFGEMALLDGSPRSATVRATSEMLTMRISRRHFGELLESEPKVSLAIMRELAARVRRLSDNPRH